MGPMHLMVFVLLGLAHFSFGKVCPGCFVNYDVNDQANEYLIEKLKNLPEGMENEKQAELVEVKSVQKQIVAGINYYYEFVVRGLPSNKLYDCNLNVFVPPHKGAEEQVSGYRCHVEPSAENGMSSGLFGGQVVLNVDNNKDLEELKPLISQQITTTQNSKYIMKVTKFFKATRQTVAGTVLRATVQVGVTNCQQSEGLNSGCENQIQDRQVCDVELWLKPWMNMKKLTKVQCQPQPKFCAGCPVEANPNEPEIKQAVERTLSNQNAQSLSGELLSLVKINKATKQVVNGVRYNVDFETASNSNKSYSCKAVIMAQPWYSEEPIVLDFNCLPA